MALQNKVSLYPSVAFAGQQVVPNKAVYHPLNLMSDGTVKVGTFAFTKTVDGVAMLSGTGEAAQSPVGIVERVLDGTIITVTDEATETYPEGANVTVGVRGQFYIKATTSGTAGQKVLVDPTTGIISFADAAAGSAVDTGWVVLTSDGSASFAADDLVIAQNLG